MQREVYKYSIKRLRVMCSSERTRILHMASQIPELLQTDFRDVDDVIRLVNRSFGIGSVRHGGAKRHDETG